MASVCTAGESPLASVYVPSPRAAANAGCATPSTTALKTKASALFNRTATEPPVKRATNPVPDQAKRGRVGSASATRPSQRPPAATTPPPPAPFPPAPAPPLPAPAPPPPPPRPPLAVPPEPAPPAPRPPVPPPRSRPPAPFAPPLAAPPVPAPPVPAKLPPAPATPATPPLPATERSPEPPSGAGAPGEPPLEPPGLVTAPPPHDPEASAKRTPMGRTQRRTDRQPVIMTALIVVATRHRGYTYRDEGGSRLHPGRAFTSRSNDYAVNAPRGSQPSRGSDNTASACSLRQRPAVRRRRRNHPGRSSSSRGRSSSWRRSRGCACRTSGRPRTSRSTTATGSSGAA